MGAIFNLVEITFPGELYTKTSVVFDPYLVTSDQLYRVSENSVQPCAVSIAGRAPGWSGSSGVDNNS